MNPPLKIVGVAGSMRDGSRVKLAIERLLEEAMILGAEARLLDLRALDLPMFRPGGGAASGMDSRQTEAIQIAREMAAWADALVLGSPDYHGSMSGALKNFLDYHWREFAGKVFGYVCASHEKGLTATEQMRTAVRQCYGWSLPYNVSFNGDEVFSREGELTDEALVRRLKMTARDMVTYGTVLRDQWQSDLGSDEAETFVARYRE